MKKIIGSLKVNGLSDVLVEAIKMNESEAFSKIYYILESLEYINENNIEISSCEREKLIKLVCDGHIYLKFE